MTVKHIALLKFKSGTSEQQIEKYFSDLANLKQEIKGIKSFKAGPNTSTEKLNQGFTHAFITEFDDELSRDTYLNSESHKKIAGEIFDKLEPLPEGTIQLNPAKMVAVFDFNSPSPPETPGNVTPLSAMEAADDFLDNIKNLEIDQEIKNRMETVRKHLEKLAKEIQQNPNKYSKPIPSQFFYTDTTISETSNKKRKLNEVENSAKVASKIPNKTNPERLKNRLQQTIQKLDEVLESNLNSPSSSYFQQN